MSGNCQSCSGCIDINTGLCRGGTLNTQCGRNGGFCQACDSAAGQTCQGGFCAGGTTCNASTCGGCCDGNTCRLPSQFTNAQCGQGAAGAACVACVGTTTCDVGGTGTCASGRFDAGFGDAGPSDFCTLFGTPCTASQCCGFDATFGLLPFCYSFGMACGTAGTICTTNNLCQ